jgi:hypothetical protein
MDGVQRWDGRARKVEYGAAHQTGGKRHALTGSNARAKRQKFSTGIPTAKGLYAFR